MQFLKPVLYIANAPVGWKCTECGQSFGMSLVPSSFPALDSLRVVMDDFIVHACEQHQQISRSDA